jgi:methionine biosynthesis protein MetW
VSNYSDSSFTKDPNSSWYKVYKAIKPGSKVLDVGCSSGNFGQVLIDKKKCVVHGIEIDKNDLVEAKKKLHKVFDYNIETDNLSGLDKDYDYIYFGDVIEHLVHPEKTLARIRPLLKHDGRLLFSVPNMTHLLVRLLLLQGKFEYGNTGLLDRTHLHYYDYDFLQRNLNEAGFEISAIDPVKKDLPEEVIKAELAKVGLKLTKEFLDFCRTSHASYYQFVGQAKVVPKNKLPKLTELAVSSPIDIFQTYLQQTSKYYEDTITNLTDQIKEQEDLRREGRLRIEPLEQENSQLKAEISAIKSSRAWKLIKQAARLKKIIPKA